MRAGNLGVGDYDLNLGGAHRAVWHLAQRRGARQNYTVGGGTSVRRHPKVLHRGGFNVVAQTANDQAGMGFIAVNGRGAFGPARWFAVGVRNHVMGSCIPTATKIPSGNPETFTAGRLQLNRPRAGSNGDSPGSVRPGVRSD